MSNQIVLSLNQNTYGELKGMRFLSLHLFMTIVFFIIPGLMLLVKKYFFVKRGFFSMDSPQSRRYDFIFVPMMLIYNVYFIYNYFS